MNEVKVGIIGFGTVGAGVADCLLKNSSLIAKRTGVNVILSKIADLDITTDRGVKIPDGILTTDTMNLIDTCDIVVELIGGTTIAKKFILAALSKGKCVVTANKALLADCGQELFAEAEKNHAALYYEASVAGGIPIIKSLREGFAGNQINSICGILNGTCNYIFTRMEREHLGFQEVLTDAQRLGYAEANPGLDIDGFDTAHKAAILASLAFGSWYNTKDVYVEGIRNVSQTEIRYATELGYKVKLLAIIKHCEDNRIELRVHPTLLPVNSQLAGVSDVFNGVMVNGDFVGDTLFYGRGAGRMATASAVVSDVIDEAVNLKNGCMERLPSYRKESIVAGLIPMDEVETRYYLRIPVEDRPGVMGKVATLLSKYGISISRLCQSEPDSDKKVSIVIISHLAQEANVRKAIEEFKAMPEVKGDIQMLRIEELA